MLTKTLIVTATAGGLLLGATPAMANDSGLYGQTDATFDGAYRQSLSILGLAANEIRVPTPAIKWLKRQQCSDGGFEAYRADTSIPCQRPNATTFSGQDTNTTSLAAVALWHTGNRKQARQAVKWLAKRENSDGGWAYYPGAGATSDTNSTALTLGALGVVRGKQNASYLRGVQQRCEAPKKLRGGIAFDPSSSEVNDNSTAQTAWTLGGGLTLPAPVKIKKSSPRLKCGVAKKGSTRAASLGYLNKRLSAVKGELPFGGGFPGTDYAGAAQATVALANAGAGRKAVKTTTRFLQKSANEWIAANGSDAPGALGLLMLVADSTGGNAKNFGGVNLPKRLAKTLTP